MPVDETLIERRAPVGALGEMRGLGFRCSKAGSDLRPESGMRICLVIWRRPFPSVTPSSQAAMWTLVVTDSAESKKSILLWGSEEDILPPPRPETIGFIIWALFL